MLHANEYVYNNIIFNETTHTKNHVSNGKSKVGTAALATSVGEPTAFFLLLFNSFGVRQVPTKTAFLSVVDRHFEDYEDSMKKNMIPANKLWCYVAKSCATTELRSTPARRATPLPLSLSHTHILTEPHVAGMGASCLTQNREPAYNGTAGVHPHYTTMKSRLATPPMKSRPATPLAWGYTYIQR